ncbi:hypothetical protein [Vibrio variabilis]|uniref:hypothetical protein n=1 Tax=Vibrio variabilis TaxID=990271 RepID=UPI000DD7EF01|nr:hypothetical protein [Vibrio variabilis]
MSINLNQPKTLIFHPGIGKTATSAIQTIGLELPTNNSGQACFSPYGVYGGAHNHFASVHPGFSPAIFEKEWKELLNFAVNRDTSTIVSSEFLIRDNANHIGYMLKDALKSGLQVKVLFAIRDYTDYLKSAYLQAVKVQWGLRQNEHIFDFCHRELNQIRLPEKLDIWARHIGDENIYIKEFTRDSKDFVRSFFSDIDITLPVEVSTNQKVNSSIPFEAAQTLRAFDRVCNDVEKRKELISFLSNIDYDGKHQQSVSNKIKKEITRNTYQHDCERLKARYQWIESK